MGPKWQQTGGRTRRRDRHGRGIRGVLVPAPLPAAFERLARFDLLVAESVERLAQVWGGDLGELIYHIDEVPPNLEALARRRERVPLAACERTERGIVISVFRRPVWQRAKVEENLGEIIHWAVVECVADSLELDPEAVDPTYDGE